MHSITFAADQTESVQAKRESPKRIVTPKKSEARQALDDEYAEEDEQDQKDSLLLADKTQHAMNLLIDQDN